MWRRALAWVALWRALAWAGGVVRCRAGMCRDGFDLVSSLFQRANN
jgi:hypothetical protein